MKTKVCYIPAIRHAHREEAPRGRIVSIGADGTLRTGLTTLDLEVKVYYGRLYWFLLKRRTTLA